ncbi:hypothetical protein D3C73_1390760 [compost metagenome]
MVVYLFSARRFDNSVPLGELIIVSAHGISHKNMTPSRLRMSNRKMAVERPRAKEIIVPVYSSKNPVSKYSFLFSQLSDNCLDIGCQT